MSLRASVLCLVLAVVAAGLWLAMREDAVDVPIDDRSKPRVSTGVQADAPPVSNPPTQQTLPVRREVPPAADAGADEPAPSTTIRGHVVDTEGRGIEGARVRAIYDGFRDRPPGSFATTAADGGFAIVESILCGAPVRLSVQADGYDEAESQHAIEWGTHSVVVVLRAGAPLRIAVRGVDGRPVEAFDVGWALHSRSPARPRDLVPFRGGPHTNGICELAGLARGPTTVAIRFAESNAVQPFVTVVQVGVDTRLDVNLTGPVPLRIRVVDEAAQPIGGVEVSVGRTLERADFVRTENSEFGWWSRDARGPLAVAEARTDVEGRCTVQVRPDGPLEVRARIEGRLPAVVEGVVAPSADEVLVQLGRGARLRGRLVPHEAATAVLDRLRGDMSAAMGGTCTLHLTRPRDGFTDSRTHERLAVGVLHTGEFDRTGLPPGTWSAALSVFGQSSYSFHLDLGAVVLRDGEATDLQVDVRALLSYPVEGSLRWNGAAPPDRLTLFVVGARARTDLHFASGGGFFRLLPEGTYSMCVEIQGSDPVFPPMQLPDLVVRRNSEERVVHEVWTGALRLRVVDELHEPVSGLAVFGQGPYLWAVTSADGRIAVEVEARKHALRVLSKSMRSNSARSAVAREAWNRGENDPFARHLVPLTDVDVAAGGVTEVEVTLPRE